MHRVEDGTKLARELLNVLYLRYMLQPVSLQYFEAVARNGSIRQACDKLFVAPSAVSRQIVNLEKELSAELFERTPHGMALTAAGEVLLRYVDSINGHLQCARSEIEDLSTLAQGTVRIAATEGTIFDFLPAKVASFIKQHPGIQFKVNTLGTHQITEQVVTDAAEIGLVFGVSSRDDLILRGRVSNSMRVIMRPGHPLAGRDSLAMTDLVGVPMALPDRTFGIRRLVERAAQAAKVPLKIQHESNSLHFIKSLVQNCDVVGFMPRITFEREEAAGCIVSAELRDPVCEQATVDIVTARGHKLSTAARSFLRHLASEEMF
ncbi:MAG: LysR family transcriptional regulator [Comamonadaceae bacterium]|nr:LysR family transcriptional regulator [Comamonadaceae bacterium]